MKEVCCMNFLDWAFIEPFWDVVDVLRYIFNAIASLFG